MSLFYFFNFPVAFQDILIFTNDPQVDLNSFILSSISHSYDVLTHLMLSPMIVWMTKLQVTGKIL